METSLKELKELFHLEDQDIRSIINSQRDVAECAERLVRTANDNGGKDNITVVVIAPF